MVHDVMHHMVVIDVVHMAHVMTVETAVREVAVHRRRRGRHGIRLLGHGRRSRGRNDRRRRRWWRTRAGAKKRHDAGNGNQPSWVTHEILPF
jgi:hypothetical protein